MTTTHDRLDRSIREWTHEPDKAQGAPAVTAVSHGNGPVLSSGGFSWCAALLEAIGGSNAAPSPTHMFLGSLAGCAVLLIKDTLAPQFGIPVDAVAATASLGIQEDKSSFQRLTLDVRVTSPEGQAAVDKFSEIWGERCPIVLNVTRPTELTITFSAG